VLALAAGGCSLSQQVGSLFGPSKDGSEAYAQGDITGSISRSPAAFAATGGMPPESDLAYARAAVEEVLARGAKDDSAPWDNPHSGARGTVTPIASAYDLDGMTCRDFLASYVRQGAEAWMQGEACRTGKGKWQVKSLRPWKRT